MSIKVCTYNMGSNANDYELLCQFINPHFKRDEANNGKFLSDYETAQNFVAVQLADKADVFCLQEVSDENRPLIKILKEKGFTLHKILRPYFDCAIALSSHFEVLNDNLSQVFEGGDVAIVVARHRQSPEKFTFVSAHMAGFKLEGPIDPEAASFGYKYCVDIASFLDKVALDTFQIIGADVNVSPERQTDRFDVFKQKNFEVLRTSGVTNVMPSSTSYRERELDFFFYRSPKKEGLLSFLSPSKRGKIITHKPINFEDPLKNASDHIPVFCEF